MNNIGQHLKVGSQACIHVCHKDQLFVFLAVQFKVEDLLERCAVYVLGCQ